MPGTKSTAKRVDDAFKRLVKLAHQYDVRVSPSGKVPTEEDLERDGRKVTQGLAKLLRQAALDVQLIQKQLGAIPPLPPAPEKPAPAAKGGAK